MKNLYKIDEANKSIGLFHGFNLHWHYLKLAEIF